MDGIDYNEPEIIGELSRDKVAEISKYHEERAREIRKGYESLYDVSNILDLVVR